MDATKNSLPTPQDNAGCRPRCGVYAHFDIAASTPLAYGSAGSISQNVPTENATVMRCQACHEAVVVVVNNFGQGMHWYPAPGAGPFDHEVNQGVASCYDEGMRCLSIGANRAAAVMFRSALSLFVRDKGGDNAIKERHLKSALKAMREDGSLHPSLWDWADHLNQIGNEGAHPEDYDDVTKGEANALATFVAQLIRLEYEMPAQLTRARALTLPTQLESENHTVLVGQHNDWLTSAGDEVRAAAFRMPPRPQALRRHRARTRTVSMTNWGTWNAISPLQSRDAGLPPARRLPRSRLPLAWGERSVNDPWRTATVSQGCS